MIDMELINYSLLRSVSPVFKLILSPIKMRKVERKTGLKREKQVNLR